MNELDHNDQFHYLDRPGRNPTKIRDSVLVANEHVDPPELLPRPRCYNMSAPISPARPAPVRSESEGSTVRCPTKQEQLKTLREN